MPLGIAFFLRSVRGEKIAGLFVVLAIFVSACVALYETIMRFIHPQDLTHLWVLAAAGRDRLPRQRDRRPGAAAGRAPAREPRADRRRKPRADRRLRSLGVVASALVVALGCSVADPIIGLAITLVILKITWDSWRTVSTTDPGETHDH